MNLYIQSAVLLVGFTGVGYILLKLTAPTEYQLPQLRESTRFTSEQNREARAFMNKMKDISQNK